MAIRRLWPDDGGRLLSHFRRLDGEARRLRFIRPVNDDFLARYCAETDWLRATMLGYLAGGELRGLGELRRLPGSERRTGELAVTVEQGWRGRGIGTALLQRLVVLARNRGIDTVYMICLADNEPVRRIARKLNARFSLGWGGLEAELRLGPPSLASHLHEALDTANLALEAALELARPSPLRHDA